MTASKTADVIVIGLGAMGAATVYQLAKRGASVIGLERFEARHEMGSSHGESRITREHVGEGAEYVPLVQRSHAIWAELETHPGELRVQCGMLTLARDGGAARRHGGQNFLDQTLAVAAALGAAPQRLSANDIRRRFPQFNVTDDTVGYFEPGAGFVRPERCIAAQLTAAKRRPNIALNYGETVADIRRDGSSVTVITNRGRYQAARVVLAAGAWTPGLAGAGLNQPLNVYRQALHWFAPSEPGLWSPGRAPVFIWFHGDADTDVFYGIPMVDGGAPGVKLATEQYTVPCDPDTVDRTVPPAESAALYDTHVAGRLNGVTRDVVASKACLYTVNDPGHGRFVIGPHPDIEGVTVVSACSGHGFKHSAGIGEALAEGLVNGTGAAALEPFALPQAATQSR